MPERRAPTTGAIKARIKALLPPAILRARPPPPHAAAFKPGRRAWLGLRLGGSRGALSRSGIDRGGGDASSAGHACHAVKAARPHACCHEACSSNQRPRNP